MKALSKHIHDSNNGLTYTLNGDYYFPNLAQPEADHNPLGHYGRMRLGYLREHRPGLYTRMLLSGKLYDHLSETDQTCQDRLDRMIPQMAKAEGINETLKARDPIVWVGRMNSIHQRAEETILAELIYA